MVDIDLLVEVLRKRGHTVDSVISVPNDAGAYEFMIDGNLINLEEARHLLEDDKAQ
jgi:hypothetical protein